MRHHHGQQGIRGDIERHAEEDIGAPLVELAGEPAIGDVELKEDMAGRERHLGEFGNVPGADDQPPRIGIRLDGVESDAI